MTKLNWIAAIVSAALNVAFWGCTNPEPSTDNTDSPNDTNSPTDTDSPNDTESPQKNFEPGCNGECDAYWSHPYPPTECVCDRRDYCELSHDEFCDNRCLTTGTVETMFTEYGGVCDLPCQENLEEPDWGFDATNYPAGPYGLKSSTCEFKCGVGFPSVECGYQWVTIGDTFPNLCLPDVDNTEVCMREFYQSQDHDLLVVDFGYLGCEPCEVLASQVPDMVDRLKEDGFNPYWTTVMAIGSGPDGEATQADASTWAQTFEPQYPAEIQAATEVLFDPDKSHYLRYMQESWPHDLGGWPRIFFVDTATMKILHDQGTWSTLGSEDLAEDPLALNYPSISEVLKYARNAIGQ